MAEQITNTFTRSKIPSSNSRVGFHMPFWNVQDIKGKVISANVDVYLRRVKTGSGSRTYSFYYKLFKDWTAPSNWNTAQSNTTGGYQSGGSSATEVTNNNYGTYCKNNLTSAQLKSQKLEDTSTPAKITFNVTNSFITEQQSSNWKGNVYFALVKTDAGYTDSYGVYFCDTSSYVAKLTIITEGGSYIYYYNGSDWQEASINYYNGSQFVECEDIAMWSGEEWKHGN